MSTEKSRWAEKIIIEVADAQGFTKNIELAQWLGVSKQTLSNWKKRGISDYSVFTAKGISDLWLRKGVGPMFTNPAETQPGGQHVDDVFPRSRPVIWSELSNLQREWIETGMKMGDLEILQWLMEIKKKRSEKP